MEPICRNLLFQRSVNDLLASNAANIDGALNNPFRSQGLRG
ncbi:hypothetical protein ASZ90_011708 [hydrocarbon metagenome]|uniref:Uncharacterized protein n=1 Tax=hydrocarbon metagenome TaxID=938273 RepID=A0A0W8FD88_9ZZZZ